MSTNYFVVQAQRDLATAQNNELQAILAYRRVARRARAAAADHADDREHHGSSAGIGGGGRRRRGHASTMKRVDERDRIIVADRGRRSESLAFDISRWPGVGYVPTRTGSAAHGAGQRRPQARRPGRGGGGGGFGGGGLRWRRLRRRTAAADDGRARRRQARRHVRAGDRRRQSDRRRDGGSRAQGRRAGSRQRVRPARRSRARGQTMAKVEDRELLEQVRQAQASFDVSRGDDPSARSGSAASRRPIWIARGTCSNAS